MASAQDSFEHAVVMSDRNYKVCFVSPLNYLVFSGRKTDVCGGAEVQQFLLGKELKKAGCSVTFVVDDFGQNKKEVHHGMDVIKTPFRYFRGSSLHFFADTVRLLKILRKIGADFYLFKTPIGLVFAMGVYRMLFGSKLVKLMANDSYCIPVKKSLALRLYPHALRCIDYAVFQSQYQRSLAKNNLGIEGPVIRNISHGQNTASAKMEKDLDLLWVGSCLSRKRPLLYLELAEQLPKFTFTLILAKGTDREFQEEVEKHASSLANVDFRGFVPYAQVQDFYKRAKLLVCTSKPDSEGFPNTFLQAWQESTPVISLDVDPDGIISTYNMGRITGTIQGMRNEVSSLLSDDKTRKEMGYNGLQYVINNHSAEVILHEYLNLFKSISTEVF